MAAVGTPTVLPARAREKPGQLSGAAGGSGGGGAAEGGAKPPKV
jgi:hypothetical protein